jgi:hypothetical protein
VAGVSSKPLVLSASEVLAAGSALASQGWLHTACKYCISTNVLVLVLALALLSVLVSVPAVFNPHSLPSSAPPPPPLLLLLPLVVVVVVVVVVVLLLLLLLLVVVLVVVLVLPLANRILTASGADSIIVMYNCRCRGSSGQKTS